MDNEKYQTSRMDFDSSTIRRCGQCGRLYDDPSLNFCRDDGAALHTEPGEVETRVLNRKPPQRAERNNPEIEYIRAAVAKHPNLSMKVHPHSNHRIMKQGHTGSMWIAPRHNGVSISATGQACRRLYREMERLLGRHHREDKKGYLYFQADRPENVAQIIGIWSEL